MGGLLRQIVATLIISYSAVNMGILFAWPAFTIRLFGSDATPLNRPMTQAEISLFGSLSSVGALISTPSAGFLLDKLGRWRCSLINAVLITCVWVILILAYYVEAILFAIFLSGVSSSIFLVGGVYISEVCQDSIRGGMTAINIVCYGVGMLLSYLLGGYLQYDIMLYVGQTLTVCGVAVLYLVKESPMFLLKTGREEEATKVVAYYRNLKASSKEVLEVVNAMKRTLNPELEASSPEEEQLQSDTKPVESQLSHTKLSAWQFFKKSPSTRRATFVTFVLMFCSCFQGLVVVMIYAEDLFSQAMPGTPPTLSCVMLALTLVLAGLVAAYLTEVAGRRTLMIYASLASALCCLGLGTQLQFHWGPNWMTAVFIYVFSVMSSFGAGTVPYVLIAELFLPEVKSILSMIVVEWAWVCNFVILFVANPIVTTLGWGPVFYTFMIIGLLTALFCFFFLPETKGLTVEAIQLLFVKKRKTPAIY